MMSGNSHKNSFGHSLDIGELLSRAELPIDPLEVGAYLQDKVVLVTGAGGSIGSELCRQISLCRPRQLLLLGRGEYPIYQIQQELAAAHPAPAALSVIGDIGSRGKMDYLFRTFQPEIVFHAAAHKFVSFVEQNPEEGVQNNVFGTQNIALVARHYQAEKFVLISTDKAVNPTSVYGATKKLAELIVQELAREGKTSFVNVRFGNVLRSRGSVIPLFEQQIAMGGPLTLTHPEMRRYFMSLHEAVHLVLQSGTTGHNGDLCILDMGEPLRILDLAQTLIRLSGREPERDISITYTGARPGEKLEEQMFSEEETRNVEQAGKLLVCRPKAQGHCLSEDLLESLRQAAVQCRRPEILHLLKELVPGYTPGVHSHRR
ncbi:MAG: polysaccharide biosynthesis protein [Candidatus Latescibacteria bacterium]|nr:polysaccharide biosynthesis protein [Candidatus Latescibacterota bacterium]